MNIEEALLAELSALGTHPPTPMVDIVFHQWTKTTLTLTPTSPTTPSPTTTPPTPSPTTATPTTPSPGTPMPTAASPATPPPAASPATTPSPTTAASATPSPTSAVPTTASPTTPLPTAAVPTAAVPTAAVPTTASRTTPLPTAASPATPPPSTPSPTAPASTTPPPTTNTSSAPAHTTPARTATAHVSAPIPSSPAPTHPHTPTPSGAPAPNRHPSAPSDPTTSSPHSEAPTPPPASTTQASSHHSPTSATPNAPTPSDSTPTTSSPTAHAQSPNTPAPTPDTATAPSGTPTPTPGASAPAPPAGETPTPEAPSPTTGAPAAHTPPVAGGKATPPTLHDLDPTSSLPPIDLSDRLKQARFHTTPVPNPPATEPPPPGTLTLDVYVAFSDQGITYLRPAPVVHNRDDEFRAAFHTVHATPLRHADTPPPALTEALTTFNGDTATHIPVDLRGLTSFEQDVLAATRTIPRGEIRPYNWVAQEIGRPKAVRAVGTALANNPVPILIPCHRVTRADGTLGNYVFGPTMKESLLRAENTDLSTIHPTRPLLASTTTKIVCRPTCPHARRITPNHRTTFHTLTEAAAQGYRPCKHCRP